jgi:integrase
MPTRKQTRLALLLHTYNPAAPIKPRKPSDETEITQTLASEDEDDQADGIGKVMSLEQVEALLTAVRGDWLEPLYVLAFLGAHRGELVGFRWLDYDPKGKRLRIAQQVVLVGSSVRITTPKSTTRAGAFSISPTSTVRCLTGTAMSGLRAKHRVIGGTTSIT